MKKILFFTIVIISFFLSGCFHAAPSSKPPQQKPTTLEIPSPTPTTSLSPTIDENDYLDKALQELDAIE